MGELQRTVVVTGASGLIGRHLCDHLNSQGWSVRALMRKPASYPFSTSGISCHFADLPDALDVDAFAGADVLIHAAYATRAMAPELARRVNELGTERVLRAARSARVGRAVFLSSLSARADARSYYGRSKHQLEAAFAGPQDLVIRPGLVLAADGGLGLQLWRAAATFPIIPLVGGGRQAVQTVHIDDVVHAIARLLDSGVRGRVSIAEATGQSLRQLLALFAAASGARARFVPVPATAVLVGLRISERVGLPIPWSAENLLGLLALRHEPTAPDLARYGLDVRDACASVQSLRQDPSLDLRWPRR